MDQISIEELKALFPHGVSESTLKRNAGNLQSLVVQSAPSQLPAVVTPKAVVPATPFMVEGKRIKQCRIPKLNKTELRFITMLRGSRPDLTIRVHAKTYLLANGVRYTPEATAIVEGREWAWEVKGKKIWDDAVVKIKVAAENFPEICWYMVWEEKGVWNSQRILPVL